MTGDTGIGDAAMIERCHQPIIGGVTNFASLSGGNVGGTLTNGNHSVVTRLASARDLRMIHSRIHRHPGQIHMAGLTKISGGDVGSTLACRDRPVVTGNARFGYRCMTEARDCPFRVGMTHIAGGRSGNVGRALAAGNHAVVARFATANDLRMIHQRIHRRPSRKHMAGFADIRGVDVCGTLARRSNAIVTSDAGVGNAAVIKRCHQPIGSGVTCIAGGSCRYMSCRFTCGHHAVMTGLATAIHLGVIYRCDGRPGHW